MILPVAGAGIALLFVVSYVVTAWVLTEVARRGRQPPVGWRRRLTEENIHRISAVAGVLAIVLLVLSVAVAPRSWGPVLLLLLTALGILFAVLTFLLH